MLKTTKFITTPSFKLAIYQKGPTNSEKLALLLPGKLDTKDYAHMRGHVNFLSKKGFLALSFDPPGTWESGDDISIYSTTNYLRAIKEIIEYYGNMPTIVIGHSRGGRIAALAATKFNQIEKVAIIMSNLIPKNKIKRLTNTEIISVRDTPKEYAERIKTFKLPQSLFEEESDLSNELRDCTKPKLFIAGSKDDLVNPDNIRKAYELSSKPKTFIMIESDHDYRRNKKMIDKVNDILFEFISKK